VYIVAAVSLEDDVRGELEQLGAAHRLRVPRVVDGMQGRSVVIDGRTVVNFASNDYLGLAGDPRVARAAADELERSGVGAGASRLIVGNHRAHVELEASIADWMQCGGVRLFNSGYAANTGVLTTVLRAGDVVFSDELNHASIIDGCRLSRATVVVYLHGDLDALEEKLREHDGRRRVIVSETLFSMDGDLADVEGLVAIARRANAVVILDEAHAIGTLGPEGRGQAAARNVRPDVLIGTLGKAVGVFGAFAATSKSIAELLWNRARSLVFSTGLPPAVARAAQTSLELVRGQEGEQRRRTLVRNARTFKQLLPIARGASDTPIAPVMVGQDEAVMKISEAILEQRVFVQGIRPPTVPVGKSRLRVAISAGHTMEQLEIAAKSIDNALRRFT